MKRSEIFFSVLLLPVDYLALLWAFVLAYNLRDTVSLISPATLTPITDRLKYDPNAAIVLNLDQYLNYLGFIIPGMLLIFALVGLYGIRSNLSWGRRLLHIIIGVSAGECMILFLFLLKKDFFLPRSTIIYSWILATLFVLVGRVLVRLIQRYFYGFNIGAVRVAIVGNNTKAKKVAKQLSRGQSNAYKVVMELEVASVEEILPQISREVMDEIVIVTDKYSTEDLIAIRNRCLEMHVSFSFIPALLTELQSSFDIQTIGDVPMIEVSPTPLEGWGRVLKRLFDIGVGILSIILLSPFFILVSLAILLFSPGPLLYKHRRIGKNGQAIDVLKFRSMRKEYCTGRSEEADKKFARLLASQPHLAEEWEKNHKLRQDPRVSFIGKIIRRTSLDELPQLFNVVGGTLSLVGPRPIVKDEVAKYGEGARLLFSVKPGMTGLWQVSGRNDTSYAERIALDTRYIEHWSIFTDVAILFRTLWMVLSGKSGGAY